MNIRIISHHDPILQRVIDLGKKNSNKLGLFPVDAFIDHAKKMWIVVAEENGLLLGYTLFRITQSKGAIYIAHLCIDENNRKGGIATLLLNEIKNKYASVFKGIGLSCREDYIEASAFWKKYGFKPKQRVRSRSKEEKYLIKWWFDFGNHDLFSLSDFASEKIKVLLDASIIIKLRDDSDDKSSEITSLMADWLSDDVDYYHAPELFNEIRRDKQQDRAELTRKFIGIFKEAKYKPDSYNLIFQEVSNLVSGTSENDISDKKQLAECIASGLEYFITTDANILDHSEEILQKFNVSILTPSEFILQIDHLQNKADYHPIRLAGVNCDFKNAESADLSSIITEFLRMDLSEKKHEFNLTVSQAASDVKNSRIKVVIDIDKNNIGMVCYKSNGDTLSLPVLRVKNGNISNTLFKQLISDAILLGVLANQNYITITDQNLFEEEKAILDDYGFDQHAGCWKKTAVNWTGQSSELFRTNAWLSDQIDASIIQNKFQTISNIEELNSYKYKIERKFWPVKFTDIDIPTYIVPIRPYWASQLFDHFSSASTLFGSKPELVWNKENIYYRNVKPVTEIAPGRIMWYASSDSKLTRKNAIVACSYLDEVHINTAKKLFHQFKRYGIYEWGDVYKLAKSDANREIKVLKFSDTELFQKPISLNEVNKTLNSHNKKTNTFASPVKVPSAVFYELYKKGKQLL